MSKTASKAFEDNACLIDEVTQAKAIFNPPKLTDKYAVLSMDVEDWYHTGYLRDKACDRSYSMLDGLDRFIQILSDRGIKAQLFVLGEVLKTYPTKFQELQKLGHKLASHGWSHHQPLNMSISEFSNELQLCQRTHEDILGKPLYGYRAPCFSMDIERLNTLIKLGFQYDSSSIQRLHHQPLSLTGFTPVSKNIFQSRSFFEFQLANFSTNIFKWPTSGGGAMRIMPWEITQNALKIQWKSLELYSLYIHPIDISTKANPPFPKPTSWLHRLRFNQGRFTMGERLISLISNLQQHGYKFTTYSKLRSTLLSDNLRNYPRRS